MELTDAQQLGLELMRANGLGGTGWTIGFDNSARRFGACMPDKKRISLSRHLVKLNDEPTVRETILHEIAHALVGKVDGLWHGPEWRRVARAIGSNGERCYDLDVNVPIRTGHRKYAR